MPDLLLRAAVPGAARAGVEVLGGRPAVVCRVGREHRRGALCSDDGETLATAIDVACRSGMPFVAVVASSGADLHEGVAALDGWGRAARALVHASGRIPTVAVATGPVVSGPALLLGIADHVVMTADAHAFVSGPHMVHAFTGVPVSSAGLGGSGVHARSSGVASLVASDEASAVELAGELLALLPANVDELPPRHVTLDPVDRLLLGAETLLPPSSTGAYDVRDLLREMVDEGELLELRASWATNLVTALATIDGRPVGIVANQPCSLAGTLDITASQKGARFVATCDAFNLPILTFVDTPGFFPGKDLEWRGMIRHGAQLAFAYARATVPRISVTLRKSYGGAYIVMDSKRMGCDLAFAWPTAEIAVMGAKGAIEILHRRLDDPVERTRLEADYEQRLLNPYVAAERGLVDAVIPPARTRAELAAALSVLEAKREELPHRAHDNVPL